MAEKYAFGRTVALGQEEAIARLTQALASLRW